LGTTAGATVEPVVASWDTGLLAWAPDLLGLGNQQVTDLAAEHDADDVKVVELEGDRLAGPQP
jgi:hypothetical protein